MRLRVYAAVLLVFGALQFLCGMNEFWDDSFIGMIYARNIARGMGPVFLPASANQVTGYEVVEGYSNPLWTFLTAGFYWLPGSVFFWVRLASFLSVGLLAFAASRLLRDLVHKPGNRLPDWIGALPAVLIVLNSSVFAYAKSGMETVTFTALVICAVWHTWHASQTVTRGCLLANALLWFLVALTRPEGILYAAAAALFLIWRALRDNDLKEVIWWVFPLFVLLAGFYVWRFSYYHEWLPNTFYAKVAIRGHGSPAAWKGIFVDGFLYVLGYLVADVPLLLSLAAVMGLLLLRMRPLVVLLLLALVSNFLFVILVGGDFWPLSRFLQVASSIIIVFAAVPVAMVAIGEGLPELASGWTIKLGRNWSYVLALVLIACQPLLPLLSSPQFYGNLPVLSRARLKEAVTARHLTPQFLMGKWLNANLPPDAVVALDQAGQIPYYMDRQVVDVLGLNDHYLARNPLHFPYLRKRGVTHLVAAVIQRNGTQDILYPDLLRDPEFKKAFSVSCLFQGVDQLNGRQTFVLFTHRDLVTQDPLRAEGDDSPPPNSLEELLKHVPRTTLEPGLVKDLSP